MKRAGVMKIDSTSRQSAPQRVAELMMEPMFKMCIAALRHQPKLMLPHLRVLVLERPSGFLPRGSLNCSADTLGKDTHL